MTEALLDVRDLKKYFPVGSSLIWGRVKGWVQAVDGVSFAIGRGETLGLVGESGCGKTTTSKLILHQEAVTAGTMTFHGWDITHLPKQDLMDYRKAVQVVFQDPYSSLSPRLRVGDILAPNRWRSIRTCRAPASAAASARCWNWWACPPMPYVSFRTSSAVGNGSALPLPVPW